MSNEILERFRSLDTPILIHYAAFELLEYSTEAQGYLRTALYERGIAEEDIKAYRLKVFPFPTMDIECGNCGERLTVERQELNDGKFTCPECHMTQLVPYPEIAIDHAESLFTGRPIPEVALPGTESESATSVELAHNAMSAIYGQGPNSIKLALGDAEKLDDGRLMGEELPDTTCAKCGKVLSVEETFLASDNFYCEKCYETLTPEEREALPAEELEEDEEEA